MLKINLLPEELQRAAKTPLALFFTLIGGVVATTVLACGVLWLWMNARSLEREAEAWQIQVRAIQDEAREVDRLNEDIELYKDREKAIIEIKARRIFWGIKLYQIMQHTPPNVWITRLTMDTLNKNEYTWKDDKQIGGRLSIECYVKGTDVATLTRYRASLRGEKSFYSDLIADESVFPDNFFGDFMRFSPMELERVTLEGYEEPRCLNSVVELDMRPRYEPPTIDPKAKKRGR